MARLTNLSRAINTFVLLGSMGIATSIGIVYADSSDNLTTDDKAMIMRGEPSNIPFGVAGLNVPPLVMITMGREHNLFTEAYSDYTDLDGDGKLEIMFDPSFEYYGLFDHKYCYKYVKGETDLTNAPPKGTVTDSGKNTYDRFPGYWIPVREADKKEVSLNMWADTPTPTRKVKYCNGAEGEWSGNFLSYATSSRIDVIRKVLYGGARVYSSSKGADLRSGSAKTTKYKNKYSLLTHSRIVRDSHAWGKVLSDLMYEQKLTVQNFAGVPSNTGNAEDAYYFLVASPDSGSSKHNDKTDNDSFSNTMRWSPSYLRYGLVKNSAMPGRAPTGDKPAYIWDWASRQTNSNNNDAIGSTQQKRIDRTKKAEGSKTTNDNLFTGNVETLGIAVVACTKEFHDLDSCYNYGTEANPIWQPSGLLQQYGQGDTPRMKFGLISGSWQNNIKGGALRANIGDFNKEIYSESDNDHFAGDFNFKTLSESNCSGSNTICGIVASLDRFNIAAKEGGWNGNPNGGGVYNSCSRSHTNLKTMANETGGICHDWGNPVGEMLYQTVRYFKNYQLTNQSTDYEEAELKIGHVTAVDPYPDGSPEYCAKPYALIIADENISFDSTDTDTKAYDSDTTAVFDETGAVSEESGFKPGYYFMGGIKGGLKGQDTEMYEFIPSKKYVTNLNQIVGLAPSVAFSFGSYNVAGVASLYSRNTLRVTKGPNNYEKALNMQTFVVAMKPNLPQINIPITYSDTSGKTHTKTVEILPFAKSVSGDNSTCKKTINYTKDPINRLDRIVQSTNQVADFYVESLGDNEGVFRISYEDFEYGSDYDMDWVVGYKYQVLQGEDGNTYIHIMLTHEDGDPYAPQHAGYVITGVENEGVFVDLGKLSAGSDTKTCNATLYELDTIINDASIDSCRNPTYWGKITDDGRNGLTQVANSGKDGNGGDACLFPSWDYQEGNYQGFWNSSNIVGYYNTFIKPHANIYYGNRRTLFNLGYTQYANFGNFNNGANSYRLHGDQDSSMGKEAKKNGTTVTTSRVFRVSKADSDSGWLKSPLWYAAKYGINVSVKPARANPNIEPDNYYLVTNPLKLRDGIAEMLSKMEETLSSGSSFVIAKVPENSNTEEDPNNAYVYGTTYDAGTWYGSVRKMLFDKNYQYVTVEGYGWNAADQFAKLGPEERLIVTADMDADTPKLVRLYAEEIPYDRNDYSKYKESASGKGLLANAGYNIFRKLINEDISNNTIDASNDYQVFVDKLVRWMAGDDKYEGINDTANQKIDFAFLNETPLRPRERNKKHFVLGDVINSDATAFKLNCKTYKDADGNERQGCEQFIAVGANDGMLHILDDLNGKPIISYVPTVMLPKLVELVRETYLANAHIPFVDSTPKVYYHKKYVARDNTQTVNTYLYGTYGLGFSGGYVLNVSNIANLAKISDPVARMAALTDDFLLWEISDKDSEYIGRQRKAPALLSLANKDTDLYPSYPFLVFGSGYKHKSANAGLVLVDMLGKRYSECGSTPKYSPCIVNEIDIPAEDPWKNLYGGNTVSRKNVLAPISDYTTTSLDEYAKETQALYYQALYFGDLYGNVWKMDLNSLGENATEAKLWGTTEGSKPKVIFKAMDASKKAQPITTQIASSYHPAGGIGLLFATGSLWSDADQSLPSKHYNDTQSVYMIRDMNGNDPMINASNVSSDDNMVKRCDGNYTSALSPRCLFPLQENIVKDSKGNTIIRVTKNPSVSSVPKYVYGWYFDLKGFSENDIGLARVYTDPVIKNTKEMVVTVNVPNVGDSCEGGGHSYILRGNWSINPYNMKTESTVKINALSNETTLFLDDNGELTDNTQQASANEHGPTDNNSETTPTKVSKNASWLRLY